MVFALGAGSEDFPSTDLLNIIKTQKNYKKAHDWIKPFDY